MPIERYEVGRSYTKRQHNRADMSDPEAVRTVMEEFAAGGPFTVERRLEDAERRAIAHLQQAGMSVDPHGPPYGDPAWLRENERYSLDWYAINILNTIRILRLQIKRGDARMAADIALDLGVLATEAKIVQERVGGSIRGAEGFKVSDRRILDKKARDEAYISQAVKEWNKPGRKKWGASKIAPLIEPDRKKQRNCRRIIGPFKPK
jgi:hypothetical protein